jgi:hypothetical protein
MKQRREPTMHIERRPNAGWDKERGVRCDAFALVEDRTGLTLRWALERKILERELVAKIRYY